MSEVYRKTKFNRWWCESKEDLLPLPYIGTIVFFKLVTTRQSCILTNKRTKHKTSNGLQKIHVFPGLLWSLPGFFNAYQLHLHPHCFHMLIFIVFSFIFIAFSLKVEKNLHTHNSIKN